MDGCVERLLSRVLWRRYLSRRLHALTLAENRGRSRVDVYLIVSMHVPDRSQTIYLVYATLIRWNVTQY
jgi:hypothetical protein